MAVSQESWMTPTMKPTPTTCMAISLEMPNRLQASGTSKSDPPATPEAPQALTADSTLKISAEAKSTSMPRVLAVSYTHLDVYKRQFKEHRSTGF